MHAGELVRAFRLQARSRRVHGVALGSRAHTPWGARTLARPNRYYLGEHMHSTVRNV